MPIKDKEAKKLYHSEYNKIWYLKNKTKYKKTCVQCGKDYSTRYDKQLYCSKQCGSNSRKKEFVCLSCGKNFTAPTCKKRVYCSRKCGSNSPKAKEHMLNLQNRRRNDIEYGEKWRKNMAIANKLADHSAQIARFKKMTGDKNYAWKGGISPVVCKIRTCDKYKIWRKSIFDRDNYKCCECGTDYKSNKGVILQVHHIISLSYLIREKLDSKIYDISNGVTLCLNCHKKTDSYAKNLI